MLTRSPMLGFAQSLRTRLAAAILAAGAVVTACAVDAPDPVAPSLPTLQITGPDTIRGVGTAVQYTANVTGVQALQVQWSSSDSRVLAADESAGIFVAHAAGAATIRATSGSRSAEKSVVVYVDALSELRLYAVPDTLLTSVEDTVHLIPVLRLPSGQEAAPGDVEWSSSDATVATVAAGIVVARGDGRAVITARTEALEASVAVRVALPPAPPPPPPPPVTVTLLPHGDTVMTALQDTLRLEVGVRIGTGTPFTPEPASVEWHSSDPAVATVQGGVVVARANGAATITARTHDAEASIAVRIAQVATDLTFGSTQYEIPGPGGTVQLEAAARDRRGHPVAGVPMSWSSSHPQRIAVNGSGLASAQGWGSATVQVAALGLTRGAAVRVTGGSAPTVEELRAGITRFEGEASASYVVVALEVADAEQDMDSLRVTLVAADGGIVASSLTPIEQGTARLPFTLHAAEAGAATQVRVDAYDAAGHHVSQTRALQVSPAPGSPVIDWIGFQRVGSDSVAVEIDVTDHQRDVDVVWLAGFDAQGGWTLLHGFEIEPAPFDEWTVEIGVRTAAVGSTHRFAVVISDAAGNLSLVHLSDPHGAGTGLGSLRPLNRAPGAARGPATMAIPERAARGIPRPRPRVR